MGNLLLWTNGSSWDVSFWSSPLGLTTLITLLACSIHHLICASVDDSLIDRLYYWCCAMSSSATLYHLWAGTSPHNVVKTMMVALAVRFLCEVIEHHYCQFKAKGRRRPKC